MTIRIGLLAAFFTLTGAAEAMHLPGGSITYSCTGNNNHDITLTLYRECSGAAMIPQTLQFSNDCGVAFEIANLLPVDTVDVSPLCGDPLITSTCNGGTQIGVQAFIYRTSVYLSPCDTWRIGWTICCRNNSINVSNTPGLWIEARLNNMIASCDRSPVFNELPIPFVCVDQPVHYDCGAVDADGNTVRYHFIDARYAGPEPTPVNYTPPYTGAEPFTGMVIDTLTGMISFTPTLIGYIVTAVQVDTYNAEGIWIGSVMRDYPFVVRACSNGQPAISSGALTSATGDATVVSADTWRICSGGAFCVEAQFDDPDVAQTLTLSSNVGTVFPAATLEVLGTNPATAHICWSDASVAPGTYYITIAAQDDACPVRGEQHYRYTVIVDQGANAGTDVSIAVCASMPPFALLDSLGPVDPNGTWIDPNGEAHGGQFDPSVDPPGDYTYVLVAPSGCSDSATVTVAQLPPTDPLCIFLGTDPAVISTPSIAPNPCQGTLVLRNTHATRVDLMDMQGRTVWSFAGGGSQESLTIQVPASVSNGSYVLRVFEHDRARALHIEMQR